MNRFWLFLFVIFPVFAMDCPDDTQLHKISGNQIGYTMYNKDSYANELHINHSGFENGLYIDGEWQMINSKSKDLNVIGTSQCLNSDDSSNDFQDAKYGTYCLCKITSIDNMDVVANWISVKDYNRHKFDNDNVSSDNMSQKWVKERDYTEDTNKCQKTCSQDCQKNMSRLIREVIGFYSCGKAVYKKSDLQCVVGKTILKVREIKIFDDSAEIVLKNISIPLQKDTSGANKFLYFGEYNYVPIYLEFRPETSTYMMGNKSYSMEKCL